MTAGMAFMVLRKMLCVFFLFSLFIKTVARRKYYVSEAVTRVISAMIYASPRSLSKTSYRKELQLCKPTVEILYKETYTGRSLGHVSCRSCVEIEEGSANKSNFGSTEIIKRNALNQIRFRSIQYRVHLKRVRFRFLLDLFNSESCRKVKPQPESSHRMLKRVDLDFENSGVS